MDIIIVKENQKDYLISGGVQNGLPWTVKDSALKMRLKLAIVHSEFY